MINKIWEKKIKDEIRSCQDLINGVSGTKEQEKIDAINSLLGRIRALNWVLENIAIKDPFENVRNECEKIKHLDNLLCNLSGDCVTSAFSMIWNALKKDMNNFDGGK
jgi:hypothetical protein